MSDDKDGAIDFDYNANGKPRWQLGRNMDAEGVTIARMLGGAVPHPLHIGEYYRIAITIPHEQPLAGMAYVQARLGSRNRFTEPKLFYKPVAGGNGEVVIIIQQNGLLAQCCHTTFDDTLAKTVRLAVVQEVGACKASPLSSHHLLIALEQHPADSDYDGWLDACHKVAEVVYTTIHQ